MNARNIKRPNPLTAKPGKKNGPLDDIEMLKRMVTGLVTAVNKLSQNVEADIGALMESVEVVGECIGLDKIEEVAKARQERRELEAAAKAKEWLRASLEQGQLEVAETVEPDGLIEGIEFGPDGATLGAGYSQAAVIKLPPEFAAKIIGKSVGAVEKTPSGNTYEIRGIYRRAAIVNPKPVEVPAADPADVLAAPIEVENELPLPNEPLPPEVPEAPAFELDAPRGAE